MELATLELNAERFMKPDFVSLDVDDLNQVLARFRHDARDFAERDSRSHPSAVWTGGYRFPSPGLTTPTLPR